MPVAVEERMIRAAQEAKPREVCGFVLVTWKLVFMANEAENEGQFAMNDDALLEFYRDYGEQCIGIFHSHPEGRKSPSNIDAEYAPRGMRYWIATLTSVYEWDMDHEPPREVVNGRTRAA
jgi:proteasome lid subunit RPN8/RPN11